jgi:hypothetical protein
VGGVRKRSEEILAAELVASYLGGAEIASRTEGHDFDLRLHDGRVICLEVTQAMVAGEIEAGKALNKETWAPKLVTCHWHLSLIKVPRVKRLVEAVERSLTILEGERVYSMDRRNSPEPGEEPSLTAQGAIQELYSLGVRRATGFPGTSPLITFGCSSIGNTTPELVNSAVLAEATKPDNLRKLRDSEADETHLFVWIDSTKEQAAVAMDGGVPPEPPQLPHEVTSVWIALRSGRSDRAARALWRLTPPGGWHVLQ